MQIAHYSSARAFHNRHLWLGVPSVILGVVVSTSIFSSISKAETTSYSTWLVILIGLLSVIAAALSGLQTFFKFSELAEKHRIAGAKYAHIKHEIELLATFLPTKDSELIALLQKIEGEWGKCRQESPNIPDSLWAVTEKNLTYEIHDEKYGQLGGRAQKNASTES